MKFSAVPNSAVKSSRQFCVFELSAVVSKTFLGLIKIEIEIKSETLKSCIWETPTLSTDADSSIDTIKCSPIHNTSLFLRLHALVANTVHCTGMQYSAVQCSAVHPNAV